MIQQRRPHRLLLREHRPEGIDDRGEAVGQRKGKRYAHRTEHNLHHSGWSIRLCARRLRIAVIAFAPPTSWAGSLIREALWAMRGSAFSQWMPLAHHALPHLGP